MVHSFISTRLDYCNGALFGYSAFLLQRLQSIQNAAARLILNIPKSGHISTAISTSLHWLPIQKRIDYKLCLFVRNCLVGTAPIYLRELCVPVSTDFYRQSLRSAARGDLMIPKFLSDTANVASRSLHRRYGTRCLFLFDDSTTSRLHSREN